MYTTTQLFDLRHTLAGAYLARFSYPWQALPGLHELILALGSQLGAEYREVAPQVWVHSTAAVAPTAFLGGPCIIGSGSEIRHCAFIRENALIGSGCVVGNSVELKNAVLFDEVQVPHFNYVGDSILGFRAHLGAGAMTSNVKSDSSPVTIRDGEETWDTGLSKCGAMVGDHAEVGCNSVLNPGTVLGANTTVYPLSCVRGVIPANTILKTGNILIAKA